MAEPVSLKRSISFPYIALYGIGTILGAGIYVVIGEVAARAGSGTPLGFIGASVLAAFSAFSYAELSARLPKSAGEAVYVQEGLGLRWLAVLVGFMVALAGMVSSATIANGFVGYLNGFVAVPPWVAIVALLAVLGGVAVWGITQSMILTAITALLEIGGLVLVIGAAAQSPGSWEGSLASAFDPSGFAWGGIFAATVLAFFAYIGFEDMVNVAEEVTDVQAVMPKAIVTALVVTAALYLAVSLVAIAVVPPEALGASPAPLALVFEKATGLAPQWLSGIAVFAIVNGALVQIIMASRVLYGMSKQGWLTAWLGEVNPVTRTPIHATALVTAIVLTLALFLPLATLARVTSLIALFVFTLINVSLVRLKQKDPRAPGVRLVPASVPWIGSAASAAVLVSELVRLL